MLEPLDELLLRLGSSGPGADVLSADEVDCWPEAFSGLLRREGLLVQSGLASSVLCDDCFERHVEPVETIDEPEGKGPRHYIVCPLIGRVFVAPERLQQWRLDLNRLALALARLLSTAGRPRDHASLPLWELGSAELSGAVHDVLVLKGTWPGAGDASESLAQGWVKPIVLTLAGDAASSSDTMVVPLGRVLTLGPEGLELDRRYLETVARQATASPAATPYVFQREGDVWAVTFEDCVTRYRATRGLENIWYLIAHRDRAVPVMELFHLGKSPVGAATGGLRRNMNAAELADQGLGLSDLRDGDAVLDAQAMQDYKRRLLEIEAELHQASDHGDFGKAEALEEEQEALLMEIKAATGLGGRSRKTPSGQERARINIRMNISNAIDQIAKSDAGLARHLDAAIKTGRLCSYEPETDVPWEM